MATETGSLSLDQQLLLADREPSACAVFARLATVQQQHRPTPSTRITSVIDGFGRSTILPRETREHRLHLTETISLEGQSQLVEIRRRCPASPGSTISSPRFRRRIIFDPIKVNPFTFQPTEAACNSRRCAPMPTKFRKYYIQNFGSHGVHP